MDFSKTLATLDTMLSGPKMTAMTKDEFEAYAEDQIAKAKAEADEDDKEEGAKKAKKRLEHLRATMKTLVGKAEGQYAPEAWTGDNGTALIPEFDHGYEDTTRKTEISETETKTPPPGNTGTQGDTTVFANPGDESSKNPMSASGTQTPASGQGTQNDNTIFEQGAVGKALADLRKTFAGAVPAKTETKKNAAPAKKPYLFPSDLADKEYIKDGIAKRAPDHWGADTEPSK